MGRVLASAQAAADTQICMAAMSISIKPPPAPNAGYGSSGGRQRELHGVTGGRWLFAPEGGGRGRERAILGSAMPSSRRPEAKAAACGLPACPAGTYASARLDFRAG
jgi:hypothetical protein